MPGKKTSIIVSSVAFLVIGACGSVAFAASAHHRAHAAQAKPAAPVPAQNTPAPPRYNEHLPYSWTQPNMPTYMAIQDQFYRDGSSEK